MSVLSGFVIDTFGPSLHEAARVEAANGLNQTKYTEVNLHPAGV